MITFRIGPLGNFFKIISFFEKFLEKFQSVRPGWPHKGKKFSIFQFCVFFTNWSTQIPKMKKTSRIWIGPTDIKFGVNIHSDKCYTSQCPDISWKPNFGPSFWRLEDPNCGVVEQKTSTIIKNHWMSIGAMICTCLAAQRKFCGHFGQLHLLFRC